MEQKKRHVVDEFVTGHRHKKMRIDSEQESKIIEVFGDLEDKFRALNGQTRTQLLLLLSNCDNFIDVIDNDVNNSELINLNNILLKSLQEIRRNILNNFLQ